MVNLEVSTQVILKGPIPSLKIVLIPGTLVFNQCNNPETSILLLKPWNSICNRRYRTSNLLGGAPFSAICACVYSSKEGLSLSFIYLNIPNK